jgi:hypothetical protein
MKNVTFIKSSVGSFLSENTLVSAFPTIGQTERFSGVSGRYTPVSTVDVIRQYAADGWFPVEASVQGTRNGSLGVSRVGFQKHLLRFRQQGVTPIVGEFLPEINLTNAHDGSGAFTQYAGLRVLACLNGAIASSTDFAAIRLAHIGDTSRFTAASQTVAKSIPILTERVVAFKERQLSPAERLEFAAAALLLRYDDAASAPIEAGRLLTSFRQSQSSSSLWHVYNTVQENLVRGGQRSFKRSESGRRVGSSRAVTSVDVNVNVNKGLWQLAERSLRGLPLVDLSKVEIVIS